MASSSESADAPALSPSAVAAVEVSSSTAATALPSRHGGERHGWQRLVIEIVLLIASAMLALAVDDWNDDRARGRLAGRVLLELKVEVEQNRKAIDDVLGYHEQMRESFHKSREALAKGETWEYPAAFDGLNQILFQRAAYDAALLSQTLPHLDSRTLSALSVLYTQQEEYTQNLRMFAAATLQTDDKDSSRDLRLTENCFKQMAAAERRMIGLLDKAATAIAAELAAR